MSRLALLTPFPPRPCGIAAHAEGLYTVLSDAYDISVIAVNKGPACYSYAQHVSTTLSPDCHQDYIKAADSVNAGGFDLLLVEHEYGLYGGENGSYLLSMLRAINIPVILSLHTVLESPSLTQQHILLDLASIAQRVIVHGRHGAFFLARNYGLPEDKIQLIPLGAHRNTRDTNRIESLKYDLGIENRRVLCTAGFISINKGIQDIIAAMPAIIREHREVSLLVAGMPHPADSSSRPFLEYLKNQVNEIGVKSHVSFLDKFLAPEEWHDLLCISDIVVSPRRDRDLISSGTLAWALAMGKPVVATPYWNAKELLEEGAGIIVPFSRPDSLAEAVIELLNEESKLSDCQRAALSIGKSLLWDKRLAARYIECFEHVLKNSTSAMAATSVSEPESSGLFDFPALKLSHIARLTDSTGIFQHAKYLVPNRNEGYCTDDNARALRLMILLEDTPGLDHDISGLAYTYTSFLCHAYNPDFRRMRNFMSYDRRWTESIGSEESHARSIWALGTVLGKSRDAALRETARELFIQLISGFEEFDSPRAWAYAIFGIQEHLRGSFPIPEAVELHRLLAYRLESLFDQTSSSQWLWFESRLTWFNAVLPDALISAGITIASKDMVSKGTSSLGWLIRTQLDERGVYSFVGNQKFMEKGHDKPQFDQQPIEAKSLIHACASAFRATQDPRWVAEAKRAFAWFLGGNLLGLSLYDHNSGGCRDGLQQYGANQNQGAESSLSYLLARQDLIDMLEQSSQ